jgi:hypothetical protein
MEVMCLRVYAELQTNGFLNPATGEPRRLLDAYRQLRLTQFQLSRELGLTPMGLAQMRAIVRRGEPGEVLDLESLRSDAAEGIIPATETPAEAPEGGKSYPEEGAA